MRATRLGPSLPTGPSSAWLSVRGGGEAEPGLLPLTAFCCFQAYAMMLSLSEDTALHTPSQGSLGAWLNVTGAASEPGTFHPVNHL